MQKLNIKNSQEEGKSHDEHPSRNCVSPPIIPQTTPSQRKQADEATDVEIIEISIIEELVVVEKARDRQM